MFTRSKGNNRYASKYIDSFPLHDNFNGTLSKRYAYIFGHELSICNNIVPSADNLVKIRLYILAINLVRLFSRWPQEARANDIACNLVTFLKDPKEQARYYFQDIAFDHILWTFSEDRSGEVIGSLFSPSILFDTTDSARDFLDNFDQAINILKIKNIEKNEKGRFDDISREDFMKVLKETFPELL